MSAGQFWVGDPAPQHPAAGFGREEVDEAPAGIPVDASSEVRARPKQILVLGWQEDIRDLVNSLDMFAPAGSGVTLVSNTKPEVCTALSHLLHTSNSVIPRALVRLRTLLQSISVQSN